MRNKKINNNDTKPLIQRLLYYAYKFIELKQDEHKHFHPSSVLDPSEEDILITKKLHGLCAMMSIPLQDHIIVGPEDNTYYSFKEHNIIVTENPDYEFALFAAEKNRAR